MTVGRIGDDGDDRPFNAQELDGKQNTGQAAAPNILAAFLDRSRGINATRQRLQRIFLSCAIWSSM